jgi:crossover junction endodeoxyribonuclease RuvC
VIFLGVDPGLTGAVASLSYDKKLITVSDYARDDSDRICCQSLFNAISAIKDFHSCGNIVCCLEKSQAMPGQGVVGMFNYGCTYGITYATLKLSGVKIIETGPQKWKKEFGLNSNKKAGIVRTKEDSVEKAIELFPSREDSLRRPKKGGGFVMLHGRSDALLMAEYCRRNYK